MATPQGERAIETLHAGDQVLAEDPQTKHVEAESLVAVRQNPATALVAVDLSDGSVITTTPTHAFWVDAGPGFAGPGWLYAEHLHPGDQLRTADGTRVFVVGARRNVGRAVVYTLTVSRDHTFFVGPARVLVHNASCARSLVKSVRLLYDIAQDLGQNPQWRAEANNLVQQYTQGNANPGLRTKHLFGNIFYLRGRNGARVFYRSVGGDAFEILAYADKSTENRVIALLQQYYKGR